jgi:CRP/FNR family transcriptional regulator, cyclic AMP receptor protein
MDAIFLWKNYFTKQATKDIYALLHSVPMFEQLSRGDLKAVERILHRRSYAEGEYIFHQGDPGLGMYIVEQGEVSVFIEQSKHEIVRLTNGEFFGELGLLTDYPRIASAKAVEDTKLFGFFQPDLFSLIETRPRIGVSVVMNLSRIIAERLHRATLENKSLLEQLGSAVPK